MANWNQLPGKAPGSVLLCLNEIEDHMLVLVAPSVSQQWRQALEHLPARIDLSARWPRFLTDVALQSITKRFRRATSITLAGQRHITDTGVYFVAAACPQLSSLNLECCSLVEVTDEGLGKLAAGCLQLSSLNLGGCSKVTDEGLGKLAADCPQLSSLSLGSCSNVIGGGVERLRAALPGCR